MSEEEKKDEQTAVANSTNEEPKEAASAESGAAQEDGLDELLKEFDERRETIAQRTQQEQTQAKTETTGTEPPPDVAALAALERRVKDQEAREYQRELNVLYGRLSDGAQADSVDVEIFLGKLARDNPLLNEVYNNRDRDPGRWNRTERALRQEVLKRFGKKVDRQVTDSKEAVASAVRSASTAAPHRELTDRDIQTMPKAEWDELQRKLGITPV